MRITLAPTDAKFCPTVTVQTANDDNSFDEVLDMLVSALVAYGFSKDTVDRGIQEFVDAMASAKGGD